MPDLVPATTGRLTRLVLNPRLSMDDPAAKISVPDWLVPGMYGVTRTTGIPARCIQFGTLSHFNHAFIYIGVYQGVHSIIEATPGRGVIISPLATYSDTVFNRYEDLTPGQQVSIVDAARSTLGSHYGFLSIAALSCSILHISDAPLEKIASEQHRFICSQNVDWSYQQAGIQCFNDERPPNLVTPDDLVQRLLVRNRMD